MKYYWTILITLIALLTLICCAADNNDDSDDTSNSNSPVGWWQEVINSQGEVDTSCYYDYRSDGKVYYVSPAELSGYSVEQWWNKSEVEKEEQYQYDWKDNYVVYYNGGSEETQPHFRIDGNIMTWYESHEGETYDMQSYKRLK